MVLIIETIWNKFILYKNIFCRVLSIYSLQLFKRIIWINEFNDKRYISVSGQNVYIVDIV